MARSKVFHVCSMEILRPSSQLAAAASGCLPARFERRAQLGAAAVKAELQEAAEAEEFAALLAAERQELEWQLAGLTVCRAEHAHQQVAQC